MNRAMRWTLTALAVLLAGLVGAAAAAAESRPQWTATAVSRPTNLAPGDETGQDSYQVTVTNTGAAASEGPVAVTDELPGGLTLSPSGASGEDILVTETRAGFSCVSTTCTYTGVVVPGETLDFTFPVDVSPEAAANLTNVVRVSGGGALDASVSAPTVIAVTPASFGIAPGGATTALSTTQAGAHPDLTTSIAFDTVNVRGSLAAAPKDTTDDLPPGFAGDLVDTPSCPVAEFALQDCPVDTQVGITTLTLEKQGDGEFRNVQPVYNLTPNPGAVAKLGFSPADLFGVQGNVTVRPGDYGLRTTFEDVSEAEAELIGISLTVWGVPADPIHDPLRYQPARPGSSEPGYFGVASNAAPAPFLTNPTACGTQPIVAAFTVDSWEDPGQNVTAQMPFGPLVGCDRLGMQPSLSAEATSDDAGAPTGLDVATKIPQTYDDAEGLSTSALKQEVVTLPEGMTVNPSSGAGLGACSEAQYAEESAQYLAGHGCPNESRLATVRILTPSLSEAATGSLFLAEPAPFGEAGKNPFGSLLALYLIARIPDRGVLIKAPGEVKADETTGQLVTRFGATPGFDGVPASEGLPPLPFSLATFSFNQGANAPLVTPPTCGDYTVQAALTPWSEPAGAPPLQPVIPPFGITASCPAGNVPPFDPQVTGYPIHGNAGAYSPFYLGITRADGEQEITGFASQLPAGLTAKLTGVPLCSEAEIALARTKTGAAEEADPSCPAGSEIGHTIAEAGVGTVLAQAPGKLYFAGPFADAPFSVVAITSAHVGPFDLGTVVVHLPLDINPETAAVTIPAGPADQIPHIIKGIVIHVRRIRVYIDKSDFMLNPTNCDAASLAVTVIGGGANPADPAGYDPVTVSDPFQVADCSNLKFAPKFKVTTSGKTSRANGASLHVQLTYPSGALGQDTNIKEVKVDLPKQLPSRLSTLQRACTVTQFDANPAGCPAASAIGTARAITPILPVALEGPAYFVSYGNEAFPELKIVLQGDGVTIVLTGDTFISKSGITSSTFKAVPDQPVTSFELTLPEGEHSALAADGDLCALSRTVTSERKVSRRVAGKLRRVTVKTTRRVAASLAMPTIFVGQNGAEIHQRTPIGVTGCPKAKARRKAKRTVKKKPRG
ncbi:MAG TPA: hypothetical protein VK756_00270 [Solirubrobacteraceae bacterium]|jgi:uncharacterized repeat protein (TIGR01451 family)|nr:hypothetical protein [Solirubrobacteraceae bacterium]